MRILKRLSVGAFAGVAALLAGMAGLSAADGLATPYQMGLTEPATDIMEQMDSFHDLLLVIITVITLFVMGLLLVCIFRYNERANPVASKTSHNTMLEVAWTVIPILILVVIAIPSFKLLYAQHTYPKADLTIKAIANQWYWGYEYPDAGGVSFDSIMLQDNELKPGQPRLLSVDNEVVVPVDKVVHVLVTANDVIHNFVVPAFGSKVDAVPGRITSTWFKVNRKGMFYGQCGELCGKLHAYMPIAIRVVDQSVYESWLAAMQSGDGDKAREVLAAAEAADKPTTVASSTSGQ
ncbi:MAG: cytochrome c oxidase subunit II [Rhizobiales bacterium]|nr:cytochrome c oxidase subunit II [Hyphomicrobiales bacterium]